MAIGDDHFGGAACEQAVHGGVDFFREEAAALVVESAGGQDPVVVVQDAGDSFHVGHEKDLHWNDLKERALPIGDARR